MPKPRVHQLDPTDGNPGDVATINPGGTQVEWAAPTGGGGGGSSGYREVLMTDGITSPPEPIWNEDGDDWLYSEVIS